jgi:hypothetical protein
LQQIYRTAARGHRSTEEEVSTIEIETEEIPQENFIVTKLKKNSGQRTQEEELTGRRK